CGRDWGCCVVRHRRVLPAMLALMTLGAPVQAAEPAEPPITGVFEIGGKTVPLPEGEWRLVAEEATSAENSAALVAVQSTVLARFDAGGDRGYRRPHQHRTALEEPAGRARMPPRRHLSGAGILRDQDRWRLPMGQLPAW